MDDREVEENVRPLGNVERLPDTYRTKSGRVLTNDDIEKLADEAERGYDVERLESRRVQVAEPVWGIQVGEKDLTIHPASACEGAPCPFHHPSEHHMVEWPKNVRLDKSALVERTCEHGVGHPDPDSLAYFVRTRGEREGWALGVHGCDGCCSKEEPRET